MKLIKISNLITLGLILSFAAVGCKTKQPPITPITGSKNNVGIGGPINDGGPGRGQPLQPLTPVDVGIGGNLPISGDPRNWPADRTILQAQTVYFDYDKSAIKASEHSKLEAVAAYLRNNPRNAVRVEGNCDERGTEEYNRSLGERRALGAREQLVQMGIAADRVETVSFGEDKPAVQGHTEAAYSKNRRDEFVVLTPP
jgi:peptidoglycan-associated lipoprotein